MTRYVVIGAGAIGGGVAGLLAEAGIDVVAVARGTHAAAIRDRGLTIHTTERTTTVAVRCIVDPSELALGVDDVLVLATKTHQADAALRQWTDVPVLDGDTVAGTAGEVLPIVVALNGVVGEDMALRWFERVLGATVWMPAAHLEPGEVIVRGTPIPGAFHIGAYPAERDETAVLDAIERDWTAAGLRIVRADDVMPWKYRKLITNIGNAFQALAGDDAGIRPLVRAAEAEARQVLDRAGIEVTSDEDEAAERAASRLRIGVVPGQPDGLGGSTWQSLARGTGDVESDYLNGEIVLIARRHGLHAPINAAVARLSRRAAVEGHRPGDVSADELARLLGLREL